MYFAMSCSRHTTVFRRLCTRGRAIAFGTGVTICTQWLDKPGVSTGTRMMRRLGRPTTWA